MENTRGKFITLEGIEGCGKSTQLAPLLDWLSERGIDHVCTKEPGGTVIGSAIRGILLNPDNEDMTPVCEALLYLADRAQHHAAVIAPALAQGKWVICDRYQDSTRAYQGAARGIDRKDLDRLFRLATNSLLPDLTLLLDLEPRVGLARANARNHSLRLTGTEGRFEAERLAFHQEVRRSYLGLAADEPARFAVVDAGQDPADVAARIREVVASRLMAHV